MSRKEGREGRRNSKERREEEKKMKEKRKNNNVFPRKNGPFFVA